MNRKPRKLAAIKSNSHCLRLAWGVELPRAVSDQTLSHEILESAREVLKQLVRCNTQAKDGGKDSAETASTGQAGFLLWLADEIELPRSRYRLRTRSATHRSGRNRIP